LTLNRLKEFRLAVKIGGRNKKRASKKRKNKKQTGDKKSPRASN
jgi:hypothetical protein